MEAASNSRPKGKGKYQGWETGCAFFEPQTVSILTKRPKR